MPKRYIIRATTEFSAAHQLHGYVGGCERVHGHNFKVSVEVETATLDEIGMGIDFTVLQKMAADTALELDHRLLNDVSPFTEVNPTAENIAAFFWQKVAAELQRLPEGERVRLRVVTVSENDRTSVSYIEGPEQG